MKTLALLLALVLNCSAFSFTTDLQFRELTPHKFQYQSDPTLETAFLVALHTWALAADTTLDAEQGSNPLIQIRYGVLAGDELGLGSANQIVISPYYELSNVSLDEIMLHEVGHFLGMGHSFDVNAIMFPHVFANKPAILGEDDILGIKWIYGGSLDSGNTEFLPVTTKHKKNSRLFFWIIPGLINPTVDFGDGSPVVIGNTFKHRYRATGFYTVTFSYSGIVNQTTIFSGRARDPRRN